MNILQIRLICCHNVVNMLMRVMEANLAIQVNLHWY